MTELERTCQLVRIRATDCLSVTVTPTLVTAVYRFGREQVWTASSGTRTVHWLRP